MSGEYRHVWLTWNLVRTNAPRLPVESPHQADRARPTAELRYRVQMARVERRWSVVDLATRVQCDAETLAAFERGDEVLSGELQQRLRTELEL